jgi:hypothetical protein
MIIYVNHIKDHVLEVRFKNGKTITHDFYDEINSSHNGLIKDYLKVKKFKEVRLEYGNLIWPGNILDIHGVALYDAHFGKTKKPIIL